MDFVIIPRDTLNTIIRTAFLDGATHGTNIDAIRESQLYADREMESGITASLIQGGKTLYDLQQASEALRQSKE